MRNQLRQSVESKQRVFGERILLAVCCAGAVGNSREKVNDAVDFSVLSFLFDWIDIPAQARQQGPRVSASLQHELHAQTIA
jgi:hypothetical protein